MRPRFGCSPPPSDPPPPSTRSRAFFGPSRVGTLLMSLFLFLLFPFSFVSSFVSFSLLSLHWFLSLFRFLSLSLALSLLFFLVLSCFSGGLFRTHATSSKGVTKIIHNEIMRIVKNVRTDGVTCGAAFVKDNKDKERTNKNKEKQGKKKKKKEQQRKKQKRVDGQHPQGPNCNYNYNDQHNEIGQSSTDQSSSKGWPNLEHLLRRCFPPPCRYLGCWAVEFPSSLFANGDWCCQRSKRLMLMMTKSSHRVQFWMFFVIGSSVMLPKNSQTNHSIRVPCARHQSHVGSS